MAWGVFADVASGRGQSGKFEIPSICFAMIVSPRGALLFPLTPCPSFIVKLVIQQKSRKSLAAVEQS